MLLRIAAINHNDPLGAGALVRWLTTISRTESEEPHFVAVEWDQDIFVAVKEQRVKASRFGTKWLAMSDQDWTQLVSSIGYEGDVWLQVYPNAAVLWLDQGREVPVDLNQYVRTRLGIYEDWLDGIDGDMLQAISNKAWMIAEGNTETVDGIRDAKWSKLIEKESKGLDGWAMLVVGADHLADVPQSIASLLRASGHTLEIEKIKDWRVK